MVGKLDVPQGQHRELGGTLRVGWPQALLHPRAGPVPSPSFLAFPWEAEVQLCHPALALLRALRVFYHIRDTQRSSPGWRYLRKEQQENDTTRFESPTFQHLY